MKVTAQGPTRRLAEIALEVKARHGAGFVVVRLTIPRDRGRLRRALGILARVVRWDVQLDSADVVDLPLPTEQVFHLARTLYRAGLESAPSTLGSRPS